MKDLLIEIGRVQRGAEFFQEQLIMVKQNDSLTGLRNGDLGVIWARLADVGLEERQQRSQFRAYFETRGGRGIQSFSIGQLPEFEVAFASTVHKSQGSEFTHVMYVGGETDSPLLTKELLYTAITRAKSQLSIFATPSTLLQSVSRRVARDSRLVERLAVLTELQRQ